MANSPVTIAYLDCFSGVSGDMLLAALLHAGLDKTQLEEELAKIGGLDFQLILKEQSHAGIGCRQLAIQSPSRQNLRYLKDILELLEDSTLDREITEQASQIFIRLAEAEAKVHQSTPDNIHFHEVGAVDTIVDIVGTLIGLKHLGIGKVSCSPLPMGHGFVNCAHGTLPLPAPAVCELLRGIPVYGVDQHCELVTPTGAVLVREIAETFGNMPAMTVETIGYGAGTHSLSNKQPNLLRLVIGESYSMDEDETVEVIETNLDDWNSEGFPYLCELLFQQGALDVSLSPLLMKKGRPGHLLRVISSHAHALTLKQTILSETSAIGLRFRKEERICLQRKIISVSTPWGKIAAKLVQTPKGSVIYPEYESCRSLAIEKQIPLTRVYRAVCSINQEADTLTFSEQP